MNTTLSMALFDEQTKHFNARLIELRSWKVNEISYPNLNITFHQLGRKPFRIRMRCDRYDELPPAVDLLDETGIYLTQTPTGSGVINGGNHPGTQRPFICSPGSLEYHTHPSHLNDAWENYKGKSGFDLGGILTQIFYAWQKTNDVP